MEEKKDRIIRIDLRDVISIVRGDAKMMVAFMVVFGVLGLAIAFVSPKTYKSEVILAPEESGQGFSGSISSLASMVGMNMKIGQTGDAIYPEIYPDLVSSTDFCLGMLNVKVATRGGEYAGAYGKYLTDYCKPSLTDYPMVMVNNVISSLQKEEQKKATAEDSTESTIIWITKTESKLVKAVQNNIECSVDKKTNVITIKASDRDPLVAATLADSARARLQVAITEYRTKKSKVDVTYLSDLKTKAYKEYEAACQKYARYADSNTDVMLKTYSTKQDNLENEMQMKYDVYQQVSEQLQLANAKLLENTPAFTTIQSAIVPVKHSNRSKAVTLVMWMVIGCVVRSIVIFWKNREKFIHL